MKRNKIIYCLALLTMLIMTVLLFSGCKGKQSFELLSPADEESGVSLNPQISWTAAADDTQYVVKISTDENFVSVVHQQKRYRKYLEIKTNTILEIAVEEHKVPPRDFFYHAKRTRKCHRRK